MSFLGSVTISDPVKLAIIGAMQAVVVAYFNRSIKQDVKSKVETVQKIEQAGRQELAKKIDDHSEDVRQRLDTSAAKLDTNTRITIAGSNTAARAFTAGNNFNEKLLRIDGDLKDALTELGRQGRNLHRIANFLMEALGKQILLEPRQPGAQPSEPSSTTGSKP